MDESDHLLFAELVRLSKDIVEFTKNSKTYPTQFQFNSFNKNCTQLIYSQLKDIIPRQKLFPLIEELEDECALCWKFYLSPRNKSIRTLDIQLGEKFEYKFIDFLKIKEVDCRKGDEKDKRFPDNVVFKDNKKYAYLEIKYQSAPWIFAFKEKDTTRECYEGSPALDIKKLKQQQELVEEGKINVPVYYVYWLDFPCVKGIFFISLEDMYNYFTHRAKLFDRKEREGDFKIVNGENKKVSATQKIHPSLFQMKSFSELLQMLM